MSVADGQFWESDGLHFAPRGSQVALLNLRASWSSAPSGVLQEFAKENDPCVEDLYIYFYIYIFIDDLPPNKKVISRANASITTGFGISKYFLPAQELKR